MRIILMMALAALALAAMGSAATDEEMLQFAIDSTMKLNSPIFNTSVSFANDSLIIIGRYPDFINGDDYQIHIDFGKDIGSVASRMFKMASAAKTITDQFPGRF